MPKVDEFELENPPKRAEVRELLYSVLMAQNPMKITVGQIEDIINSIIDVAIQECNKASTSPRPDDIVPIEPFE